MSTLTPALRRPVLIDHLFARSITTDVVMVAAGAALTAIAAQLTVPLWPVPVTAQTLAVLLVGSALGPLRGSLAMALYAILGIVGLPVFSDASHGFGVIAGPSGGYIIGFIGAAGLTGWLAKREWDHRIVGAIASFAAGSVVVFAVGLPWLAASLHLSLASTLQFGLYPFIVGGVVKALLAAGIIRFSWTALDRAADRTSGS